MPKFTDQEVVAAINSCIDLQKLDQLPSNVVDRFKDLIRKKRVGAVCFFRTSGFGLRVYTDSSVFDIKFDGCDMADITPKDVNEGRLNLDPVWVQCNAELYVKASAAKEYVVATKDGRKFLRPWAGDLDDEPAHTRPIWDSSRRRATVFTDQSLAVDTAGRVNGIVLEKEST